MAKIKKQHRKKKFNHNVNRKRLRNKINNTGKIVCKPVEKAWEKYKSVKTNLEEMGLSYDPNETITTTYKEKLLQKNTDIKKKETETNSEFTKFEVAVELEKEAKAPRKKMFRLPKKQVEWLIYLLNKYRDDYKAMARDKKNYYQETWRQIYAKIKQFEKIPEQYNKYVKQKESNKNVKLV